MDRFVQFPVGPGIEAAMRARGDRPTAKEWYPQSDFCLAFGEQGQYVYTPVTNVTRFIPFA